MTPNEFDRTVARLTQIYDDLRTALLSKKYYSARLKRFRDWNKAFELIVALAASAPIGAWAVWRDGPGKAAWGWLAAVSAVVAVVKPVVNLPKEIEKYSKSYADYNGLYHDLHYLVQDIVLDQGLTDDSWKRYQAARNKSIEIAKSEDSDLDKKLQRRCFEEVKAEIPAKQFWMPRRPPP